MLSPARLLKARLAAGGGHEKCMSAWYRNDSLRRDASLELASDIFSLKLIGSAVRGRARKSWPEHGILSGDCPLAKFWAASLQATLRFTLRLQRPCQHFLASQLNRSLKASYLSRFLQVSHTGGLNCQVASPQRNGLRLSGAPMKLGWGTPLRSLTTAFWTSLLGFWTREKQSLLVVTSLFNGKPKAAPPILGVPLISLPRPPMCVPKCSQDQP